MFTQILAPGNTDIPFTVIFSNFIKPTQNIVIHVLDMTAVHTLKQSFQFVCKAQAEL